MGVHLYTFVGPYATCKVQTVTERRKIRACPKCPPPQSIYSTMFVPFCALCGTAIGDVEVTHTYTKNPHDLVEEDTFNRCAPAQIDGSHILMPNHTGPRKYEFSDGEVALELTAEMQDADLTWFKKRYASELEAIRKEYPALTVVWGVCAYYY